MNQPQLIHCLTCTTCVSEGTKQCLLLLLEHLAQKSTNKRKESTFLPSAGKQGFHSKINRFRVDLLDGEKGTPKCNLSY